MRTVIHLILCLYIGIGWSYAQGEARAESPSSPYLRIQPPPSYIPTPVRDSSLLELLGRQLGKPSPIVSALLSAEINTSDSITSLATSILSLPLVTDYRLATARLSLPALSRGSWSATPQSLTNSLTEPIKLNPEIPISMILAQGVRYQLQKTHLDYFSYGSGELASLRQDLAYAPINTTGLRLSTDPLQTSRPINTKSVQSITEEIGRQYWVPNFESSIQFSQNYLSENWYKGGSTNLNILMRNYFALTYTKDRIQWKNELESKLSIYNADKDSVHRYRIADDLLRLHSNFGLRAIRKIYYTIDTELRTQLFNTHRENSNKLISTTFSPMTLNFGLGMKWEYQHTSTEVYGRKLSLSFNVAPFSYTYRVAPHRDIDLQRYGLTAEKAYYHRFGSTIRASWQWDVNMNLSWSSRVYFNTSYESVEAEWENTLNMRLTRLFSTQVMLHLRYDDAVPPSQLWNRYLQINEVISFGFSYRL